MESFNWPAEHSEALRQYMAQGMSYSAAADAINKKFHTAYTRNAAISRGKRMGLTSANRPHEPPMRLSRTVKPGASRLRSWRADELALPWPPCKPAKRVKLRCVGVKPRLLALVDLEAVDCRYPYGGDKDGEAITFCGHPCLPGVSYCAAHFHLTRGDGTASERAAAPIVLRLVAVA